MKSVGFWELQKRFSQVTGKLKAGESMQVAKHGALHGHYVRAVAKRRKTQVNVLARLEQQSHTKEEGQKAIERMLASLR